MMANEKRRLIDANAADVNEIPCYYDDYCTTEDVQHWLNEQPTFFHQVQEGYLLSC